jgi:nucleoside-diphosphate-sugar epimerase
MTRSASKEDLVRSLGGRPVVADALDPDEIARVVAEAEPEVIIHQLTAISGANPKHFDRDFALTNRLRTEGTDHLLAAAKAVGAKRFIAQSFAGWPFARTGGPVKGEDAPLDESPPKQFRETLAAIRYLEREVSGADRIEGIALRYGGFYGPGTSISNEPGAEQVEMIRKRRLPIVGAGTGIWSLVHIEDAAAATVAAVDHGDPGVYNVTDDEPAPVSEVLPALAEAVGAKPPRRIPRWIGRLFAGEAGVVMMTELRGAANAKAKRELGWELRYPSWRLGFREGLG